MNSSVSIDTEKPDQLMEVLNQSLETEGPVNHELNPDQSLLEIKTETETLGQLRGCTDTVFRLGTLSKKILER